MNVELAKNDGYCWNNARLTSSGAYLLPTVDLAFPVTSRMESHFTALWDK